MKLLDDNHAINRIADAVQSIKASVPELANILHSDEDRLVKWVQQVIASDPSRLDWHIRRLQGYGGSDIGTLALELLHQEMSSPIGGNAFSVIAQKLCMAAPVRPKLSMKIGSQMEFSAKELLVNKIVQLGGYVDTNAHALLNEWNNDRELRRRAGPEMEFIVGEADLIAMLQNPTTGEFARYVFDIKLDLDGTSRAVIQEYIYQVHHYSMILERGLGLPVAGLRISKYGPDDDGYEQIRNLVVPLERERYEEIARTVEIAETYRLSGRCPAQSFPRNPRIEDPEEVNVLTAAANEHFAWDSIAKHAESQKELARRNLESLAGQVSLDFNSETQKLGSLGTLRLGPTNVRYSLDINEAEAVEALLTAKAIEKPEDVMSPSGALDESLIFSLFEELAAARDISVEELLKPYRKLEFDREKILEIGKEVFKDAVIPGIFQKFTVLENKKSPAYEPAKEITRDVCADSYSLVLSNLSERNEEAEVAKPAKKSAATTKAKPSRFSIEP